jgi:hypothetical protein
MGIACALIVAFFWTMPPVAAAAELSPLLDAVHWGERSDELAHQFGARAIRLSPPIEFGDSYVDVALRDQMLGGFGFAVYFQMDKTTRRLKRVMLERQRHGGNMMVWHAVTAALERDYGAPEAHCGAGASGQNGYQAAGERVWQPGDLTIRAVFHDTSLEASEGCFRRGDTACGLTGHLYLHITPRTSGERSCG